MKRNTVESYERKMYRLESRKHKPIVIKVFDEVDLRCGHHGLGLIARKSNIDLAKLPAGEFLLFINSEGSALKLLANGNVMVHLKSGSHEKIEMKVLEQLPRLFNGSDFDFKKSAELGLKKVA